MDHVAIVGAGIFGVTAALTLRARGCRVQLIDPGAPHPDAASTDISKVIRADYGSDAFYSDLMQDAFAGWERWNEAFPTPLYHQDGFLLMAGAPMEPGGFEHDSFHELKRRGYPVERLDAEALASRFPAWAGAGYPDGYVNRRAGWAHSAAVVAALLAWCRRDGVERVAARATRVEPGLVTIEGGQELRADTVVVAAGAWTPTLLPSLDDLMWATGQPVLHFRVDPAAFRPPHFLPWAADISGSGWYGFPAKADGTLKVANHGRGVRMDPRGPRAVAGDWPARFRDFFDDKIPSLSGARHIASRLCLYCDTFDGDLWIDRMDPGLVVAAGGSGHGFKFAPVLGDLIADAVFDTPGPFAPRFARRERGPRRTEHARNA